jgi:hypothetical protein
MFSQGFMVNSVNQQPVVGGWLSDLLLNACQNFNPFFCQIFPRKPSEAFSTD